jgi:hypothetical protein
LLPSVVGGPAVGVGDAGSPERPDDVERHASDCCVSGCVGFAAVDVVDLIMMLGSSQ